MNALAGRVVVASGNRGKLAEFERLLGGSGIEFVAQGELGVEDVAETGLCVDALAGAPGLYSARYAGAHGDAGANIARLLRELDGVPDPGRAAHFHCTLVLLRHAEDPRPLLAQGEWHGRILHAPRGGGGFGYDPVFLDPASGLTAAELDPDTKARASHRGQALAHLRDAWRDGWREAGRC